ncbi:MAG: FKBP-type peptidyl-prolyl cis-trans isomerase [Nitrospiraceae bacterium]|nr:FKBP-type peptidyl-prolyl cis-trans isomerase [Nitrospiraceae bacterium]
MTAKYGHTVRVYYRGTARRGIVFGTTRNGKPLEFTIGQGLCDRIRNLGV